MNSEAHKIADRAAVILAAMVMRDALRFRPDSLSAQEQAVRIAIALQELAREQVEAAFMGE